LREKRGKEKRKGKRISPLLVHKKKKKQQLVNLRRKKSRARTCGAEREKGKKKKEEGGTERISLNTPGNEIQLTKSASLPVGGEKKRKSWPSPAKRRASAAELKKKEGPISGAAEKEKGKDI